MSCPTPTLLLHQISQLAYSFFIHCRQNAINLQQRRLLRHLCAIVQGAHSTSSGPKTMIFRVFSYSLRTVIDKTTRLNHLILCPTCSIKRYMDDLDQGIGCDIPTCFFHSVIIFSTPTGHSFLALR